MCVALAFAATPPNIRHGAFTLRHEWRGAFGAPAATLGDFGHSGERRGPFEPHLHGGGSVGCVRGGCPRALTGCPMLGHSACRPRMRAKGSESGEKRSLASGSCGKADARGPGPMRPTWAAAFAASPASPNSELAMATSLARDRHTAVVLRVDRHEALRRSVERMGSGRAIAGLPRYRPRRTGP